MPSAQTGAGRGVGSPSERVAVGIVGGVGVAERVVMVAAALLVRVMVGVTDGERVGV